MASIDIDIGRDLRKAAADVAAAWKAAENGRAVEATDRIVFRDWTALNAVLTPKRVELLKHLRHAPSTGVRALARSLDRDVRRVHEDVVALAELELITRNGDGSLSNSLDEITSTIRIAA